MQTSLEPQRLEKIVSEQTGLKLKASTGVDGERQRWYLLRPHDPPVGHAFGIRTTLEWRRLRMNFEPDKFAGSLLADMGNVDAGGRSAFQAILADCCRLGSQVDLKINGSAFAFDDERVWEQKWERLTLSMHTRPCEPDVDLGEEDGNIICDWTGRFSAAVVAVLPTEEVAGHEIGYPEGALTRVQVNRYERDRRNHAVALAIHGSACKGCGLKMETRYGAVAAGLIEIHHITPVSQLGAGYVIDPARDLIPLCPNCHAVVHRRDPPLSVSDLERLLEQG